jgi:hypothetical protein
MREKDLVEALETLGFKYDRTVINKKRERGFYGVQISRDR